MSSLDPGGRSPLHYAALENRPSEIKAKVAGGEDPNLGDRQGFTPLHLAAQEGSIEAAATLLECGAIVDAVNVFGNSPLSVAVFNSRGEGEMIRLLRAHGADPFLRNRHGQSPVGLARLIGNYDVAQFFDDLYP